MLKNSSEWARPAGSEADTSETARADVPPVLGGVATKGEGSVELIPIPADKVTSQVMANAFGSPYATSGIGRTRYQ